MEGGQGLEEEEEEVGVVVEVVVVVAEVEGQRDRLVASSVQKLSAGVKCYHDLNHIYRPD